jgi:hypothetical protein
MSESLYDDGVAAMKNGGKHREQYAMQMYSCMYVVMVVAL